LHEWHEAEKKRQQQKKKKKKKKKRTQITPIPGLHRSEQR